MLPTAFKVPKERFIYTPDRTHNRIRSPRLAASDPQNTVGKGSRKIDLDWLDMDCVSKLFLLCSEPSTQNWCGQEESDCN